MKLTNLTPASQAMFRAIVADIPNWNGCTPTFNHILTNADKGTLTDLKRKGLVESYEHDGDEWIELTREGHVMTYDLNA